MNLALSLEAGLKEEDESIHVDLSVDGDHLGMLISLWNLGRFCFPFFFKSMQGQSFCHKVITDLSETKIDNWSFLSSKCLPLSGDLITS